MHMSAKDNTSCHLYRRHYELHCQPFMTSILSNLTFSHCFGLHFQKKKINKHEQSTVEGEEHWEDRLYI